MLKAELEYINEEDRVMTIETKYNIGDEVISCIEWLIKEGCFNKEYLEE